MRFVDPHGRVIYLNTPQITIPVFIGFPIIGQIIGNKIVSDRKKLLNNSIMIRLTVFILQRSKICPFFEVRTKE